MALNKKIDPQLKMNNETGSAQMTNDTPFWRTSGRKEAHTDQKKVTLA